MCPQICALIPSWTSNTMSHGEKRPSVSQAKSLLSSLQEDLGVNWTALLSLSAQHLPDPELCAPALGSKMLTPGSYFD